MTDEALELVRDLAAREAAAAYADRDEMIEVVADAIADESDEAERDEVAVRELAETLVDAALAAHAAAEATWGETDNDRLTRAFAALEARGVLAREHYWCCSSCGHRAMEDELAAAPGARGYVFFHAQATEAGVDGNLPLDWGVVAGATADPIAAEIVGALRAEGLRVRPGEARLHVAMTWRRRRGGATPARP